MTMHHGKDFQEAAALRKTRLALQEFNIPAHIEPFAVPAALEHLKTAIATQRAKEDLMHYVSSAEAALQEAQSESRVESLCNRAIAAFSAFMHAAKAKIDYGAASMFKSTLATLRDVLSQARGKPGDSGPIIAFLWPLSLGTRMLSQPMTAICARISHQRRPWQIPTMIPISKRKSPWPHLPAQLVCSSI